MLVSYHEAGCRGQGKVVKKGLERPLWSEVLHTKSMLGLLGVKAEGLGDTAVRLYFNPSTLPSTNQRASTSFTVAFSQCHS